MYYKLLVVSGVVVKAQTSVLLGEAMKKSLFHTTRVERVCN